MAAPFGFAAWMWLKNSPVAQGVAMALGALGAFWAFMTLRDRRIRSQAKREARQEVIEQIKEQTDEAIQRVEDERDRVRSLNDEQLRKLAAKDPNNRGRLQNPEAD